MWRVSAKNKFAEREKKIWCQVNWALSTWALPWISVFGKVWSFSRALVDRGGVASMPKALLSWLFKWNKTIADYSNERWTMFKLPSWILMKWALKTDDDKGGQKQCQLSEAQLLSTSLGSKWMLLVMCFADMTYLLCFALMDLWFRWKWKRKKFALWLVCVSTSAARICDTSTLGTCHVTLVTMRCVVHLATCAICTMCIVLCILFAQSTFEHTGAVQNGRCSLNSWWKPTATKTEMHNLQQQEITLLETF